MLEITSNTEGMENTIYPTLIWDDDMAVLVDTGFPGQLDLFRGSMEKAGVPFERLNKVIITHQDMDHMGNLLSIVNELKGKIQVIAHEEEKQYINGEKTPVKIADMESRYDSLPDDMKAFYKRLKTGFTKFTTNVDKTVADGEVLPYCGGIVVIHTPGHTPGHISLYHMRSKTLIAGDAMNVVDGHLTGPTPQYTYDMGTASKSLKKFKGYEIENVICYHGGLYRDNPNEVILRLSQEL